MSDLKVVASGTDNVVALGGGNPAIIPAVNEHFRKAFENIAVDAQAYTRTFASYDGPLGNDKFIQALVDLFNHEYQWDLTTDNIALTNGSQNAFFMLFNLFGGRHGNKEKSILLPITPEYIGYEDVAVGEPFFKACQPDIEHIDEQMFKYRINQQRLQVDDSIGALCVSRPTNPTGNVITDNELDFLNSEAQKNGIPLIIDNAYGAPFPNIIHAPAKLIWNSNIILSMSVSKMGLPGARTGIVVADKPVISALAEMNSVFNLAPASLAPAMLEPLFASREVLRLCDEQIKPFYQARADIALQWFRDAFEGLPAKVHKPEGSIFLWLWFPTLSIGSQAFYEKLKRRGVIVVPGHYFFPGADKSWGHTQQCIRVNIASNEHDVQTGIGIIADELKATLN